MSPSEIKLRKQQADWRKWGRWLMLISSAYLMIVPYLGRYLDWFTITITRSDGTSYTQVAVPAFIDIGPFVAIGFISFVVSRWNGAPHHTLLLELSERIRNEK